MEKLLSGVIIYAILIGSLIFVLLRFPNTKRYLSDVSILVALIGVLMFALAVPVYPGVGVFGPRKLSWLYHLRIIVGNISNILIAFGTTGQLISLFIKYK